MKKTMLALMATVGLAFGAKADGLTAYEGSTAFETAAFVVDEALPAEDEGQTGENLQYAFWSGNTSDSKVVDGGSSTVEYYKSGAHAMYASLDTGDVLLRKAYAAGTVVSFGSIYFDTMVQFTASDDDVTPETGDKLIVWMKADEENNTTNLIITAGVLDPDDDYSLSTSRDFTVDLSVEAGEWYRLTVKTFDDIGLSKKVPGFKVYINGNPVSVVEADKDGLYNGYFASLVDRNATGATTLTGIGFKGTGAVDDIAMTSDDPIPEVVPTTVNFSLTVTDEDTGADSITYKVGEDDPITVIGNVVESTAIAVEEQSITIAVTVLDDEEGTYDVAATLNGEACSVITGTTENDLRTDTITIDISGYETGSAVAVAVTITEAESPTPSTVVTPTADEIASGKITVTDETTAIKVGTYEVPISAFNVVETTATVAAPVVADTAAEEDDAFVIDDEKNEVTINVNPVAGLYYGVSAETDLGDLARPTTLTQYTGSNKAAIFTVTKPEGTAAFFKVYVDIKE